MKTLTTLISAFFFLILGVSQVSALPDCPSSGYFNNCQGTYFYGNGDKYVGDFKDHKRHGQGTYTYPSGSKYVGDWKDDKMHGQGTLIFPDGSKWIGAWANNYLNGYAITYYTDGSINREGIFKDGAFMFTQKKSKVDMHKEFCEEIGYTPKTEKFADCVLKLMDKD